MALADDLTSLESALTTVRSADLPAKDIVQLLKVALLKSVTQGGKIYASYSIGGRTVQMGIREARELLEYFRELAIIEEADGDIVANFAEFRSPGS